MLFKFLHQVKLSLKLARVLFRCRQCRARLDVNQLDEHGDAMRCPRCGYRRPIKDWLRRELSERDRRWIRGIVQRSQRLTEDERRRWHALLG
ncbi:MAG TPA: hypothetical protein VGB20_07210 [bacterium]